MVYASHVIFCAYGFWLPNDPRGSWSDFVGSWELLRFGRATQDRFVTIGRMGPPRPRGPACGQSGASVSAGAVHGPPGAGCWTRPRCVAGEGGPYDMGLLDYAGAIQYVEDNPAKEGLPRRK